MPIYEWKAMVVLVRKVVFVLLEDYQSILLPVLVSGRGQIVEDGASSVLIFYVCGIVSL